MITLLTYDAPHYKTERFLMELCAHGLRPHLVIGAPWVKLDLPPSLRLNVRHEARHPADLCGVLGLNYMVRPHAEIGGDGFPLGLGVIGGARIIPREVIERFPQGLLNMHPGLIPLNRGLSNIARAVREGWPQIVTAHLVDERVDAGRVIDSVGVDIAHDDEPSDLAEKMLDAQVGLLVSSVRKAQAGRWATVPRGVGGYEKPMALDEETRVIGEGWESYRATMAP